MCKCEKVTEAEVVAACHRAVPVESTQAVRKRTRAGMGHCQGDPSNFACEAKVRAIVAREARLRGRDVGTRPWPASSLLPRRWLTDADRDALRGLAKAV